ncbi:MAG: DUF1592 domain-containing protein [Prosthecobacter sp.]
MKRLLVFLGLFSSAMAADFEQNVLPILKSHCNDCHSTKRQKGDLDLEQFSSVIEIQRQPHVWEQVLEQLANNEMPPKDKPQLSKEEKQKLTQWTQGTLDEIALANAGDPGPVVLRRLSNMEYTYTVRDLTCVAALDPAKEFPVDGAAGEGFTNVGAALVMSPALLTKYLDAAKEIASHAVLLPDGIRFSEHTSERDWTDETLAKIRALYARHTRSDGTVELEVPGAKVVDEAAGRLPVGKYLDAIQGRASGDGLSAKYLAVLREALAGTKPSPLLDPLRLKFRAKALTAEDIKAWQQVLWRFASVGHIGKENGPKAWQEPVTPLVTQHEMRVKLTGEKDTTLYLTTSDAGDGNVDDTVVWANPRLVAAGRPDLPASDLPALVKHLEEHRTKVIASTEKCLAAVQGVISGKTTGHHVDPPMLDAWLTYLGLGRVELTPLLTRKLKSTPDYAFIQGWTGEQALSVLANSSDADVRTPGLMKAHSVATHPSPTLASVIAWRSPVAGMLRIQGSVTDAHPECGNGVTWSLEVRRGAAREILAGGITKGGALIPMGPFENVRIRQGDAVAVVIGPRDGSHVCDLTAVNVTLNDGTTTWDLGKDVSPNILAGNPHGPWHFLSQPATLEASADLPEHIAEWLKYPDAEHVVRVRRYLESDLPLNSPLLAFALRSFSSSGAKANLQAKAPSTIEVKIPAALGQGMEFVVTGKLAAENEGSVQMQVLTTRPAPPAGIIAGKSESAKAKGSWSDNNLRTQHSVPVIVGTAGAARQRFEAAFDEFRALFPIALCYPKIVPVDEVVTLTLFHREDEPLKRLMLDDAQSAELDRLWEELLFVSEAPLKQVDVFEQLYQFATQDAKPSAFEPMRQPILQAAEAFKKQQTAAEARQVEAVIDFAARAWRRPLTKDEAAGLRQLKMPARLLLARVLASPAFLYRGEKAGDKTAPVRDHELATRLSYFLWSSTPDEELRQLADAGKLHDPEVLVAQTRRMLKDANIRRLATEFGCQWLHVRDVETLEEKSERHFPTFASLRGDMQEEATRFFLDLFQGDRSVLSLLDADHTFVNAALAKHYALDAKPSDWQRIDGLRAKGRGGILGFAATLSKQSGASRTSPILRGNWLSEVVLGERLPRPPKDVPILPEEAPQGLTERQLIERHSSDAKCAGCHQRIDPFGFALEGFDAIGRAREADTQALLADGTRFAGLDGLRSYLVTTRRDDFVRQFCRKLLGYALGRSVQLSDKPLIETMIHKLHANEHRVSTAIELIVRSPQFRDVRGRDFITHN